MAYGQFTRRAQNRSANIRTSSVGGNRGNRNDKPKKKAKTLFGLTIGTPPKSDYQKKVDSGKATVFKTGAGGKIHTTSTGKIFSAPTHQAGKITTKAPHSNIYKPVPKVKGRFDDAGKNWADFRDPVQATSKGAIKGRSMASRVTAKPVKASPAYGHKPQEVINRNDKVAAPSKAPHDNIYTPPPTLLRDGQAIGGNQPWEQKTRKFFGEGQRRASSKAWRASGSSQKKSVNLSSGSGNNKKLSSVLTKPYTSHTDKAISTVKRNQKIIAKAKAFDKKVVSLWGKVKSPFKNVYSGVDSAPWLSKARRMKTETAKQEKQRVLKTGSLNEGQWGTIKSLGKAVQKKTPVFDKKVKNYPYKPVYTTKVFPPEAQYYSTARATQGRKWWLGMRKYNALVPTEVR